MPKAIQLQPTVAYTLQINTVCGTAELGTERVFVSVSLFTFMLYTYIQVLFQVAKADLRHSLFYLIIQFVTSSFGKVTTHHLVCASNSVKYL